MGQLLFGRGPDAEFAEWLPHEDGPAGTAAGPVISQ